MAIFKKRTLWVGIVLLAVVGIIAFRLMVGRGTLPEGLIQANGRIDDPLAGQPGVPSRRLDGN